MTPSMIWCVVALVSSLESAAPRMCFEERNTCRAFIQNVPQTEEHTDGIEPAQLWPGVKFDPETGRRLRSNGKLITRARAEKEAVMATPGEGEDTEELPGGCSISPVCRGSSVRWNWRSWSFATRASRLSDTTASQSRTASRCLAAMRRRPRLLVLPCRRSSPRGRVDPRPPQHARQNWRPASVNRTPRA